MDKISPISIVDRPIIIDNIWTRRSSSPTASSDNRTCRTAVTASKRWCYEVRVDAAVATLACRLCLLMVLFGTSSSSSGGSGSSYTCLQCFPFINVFVHLSGEMTRLWKEWSGGGVEKNKTKNAYRQTNTETKIVRRLVYK